MSESEKPGKDKRPDGGLPSGQYPHGWWSAGFALFLISAAFLRAESEWLHAVGWLLLAGTIGTAILLRIPASRNCAGELFSSLLQRRFPDEQERKFALAFVREFAPVLVFVACVYVVFWFLGFLEEIVTVTILAFFAWCAKMEKYYGGGFDFPGQVLARGATYKDDFVAAMCPFFSLTAFPSGTKNNPTINIGRGFPS